MSTGGLHSPKGCVSVSLDAQEHSTPNHGLPLEQDCAGLSVSPACLVLANISTWRGMQGTKVGDIYGGAEQDPSWFLEPCPGVYGPLSKGAGSSEASPWGSELAAAGCQ